MRDPNPIVGPVDAAGAKLSDDLIPQFPYERRALATGFHHFLVARPETLSDQHFDCGPYPLEGDLDEVLRFYELVLTQYLPRWASASLRYRTILVEVGERLRPALGRFFVVAETNYLRVQVAGGFQTYDDALWMYGLLIDHAATRLAYLGEELFDTLHIDIEEQQPDLVEPVWVRPIRSEPIEV